LYRDIPEEMRALIEPIVQEHGLELVDFDRREGRPPWHLRVIVDTPGGDGRVPVDVCAEVSRQVGANLDAFDLIPARYNLEVSSPGLDRVLAREKDVRAAVGSEVKIETRRKIAERRRFRGTLVAFEAGVATVLLEEEEAVEIPFDDIKRGRSVYQFTREDFTPGS